MRGRFRPPLFVIVAALSVLMAVLATLQYIWLGRISDAERESRRSTLGSRATAFASDFDKELTLAYVLFQVEPFADPASPAAGVAARFAVRHERWLAAARFPRLIKSVFIASRDGDGTAQLQRFDPATKSLEPAEWPPQLEELRTQVAGTDVESSTVSGRKGSATGTFVVRRIPAPLWEDVPALLVPTPMMLLNPASERSPLVPGHHLWHTVLVLDGDYIAGELLPALADQHLRAVGDGVDYEVAVVSTAGRGSIYRSVAAFDPKPDAKVDAGADLFQVKPQDFPQIAADVRRFSLSVTAPAGHLFTTFAQGPPSAGSGLPGDTRGYVVREGRAPLSVLLDQAAALKDRSVVASVGGAVARAAGAAPRWRLLVKHPSGSLETAVNSTRRRNLLVSSSILGVLGASMALLVLSARRSQEVARQQMEFVAAVSHELRTPLAVIRSAGDNLADGVVGDAVQIRKYGELVRSEGRRLSEMVEQILEFAGIQSGHRRLEPRPVDVAALVDAVLSASAALIESARVAVAVEIADGLPPVQGDEPALRRALQNLVGNAIKYGAEGRWIGIRARRADRQIAITVADRGLGIAASEQPKIFEPFYRAADVVAAQIQGAGLGLSLVQRIVDAHGGRIEVNSTPGEGSEFTLFLPAAGPEPVHGADPRAAEAARYT